MLQTAIQTKPKLTPGAMVSAKPVETAVWRQEMSVCGYDHATQTRQWTESDKIRRIIMSTGAPTSSTMFDGESDE